MVAAWFASSEELIQERLARIVVNIESSRWLVYRAALARQSLHDYVEQLKIEDHQWQSKLSRDNKVYYTLRSEADNLSTIAKFHSSNSAFDSANKSVQIFGSYPIAKLTGSSSSL